ncbi:hypothetical protein F7725_010074 [Dissostichus mawsoni]|uniref:Cadherin domain-containing protein n=1 Tax=Dissostichus mawsoni TaxID=36200 RepID=A0A7J5XMH6_DISMA|nr:hypothetical protein F7725_010074 [Dissostichus mawsoni]
MNDNAPQFRRDVIHLDISEATPKGEILSQQCKWQRGVKICRLILTKSLDREQQAVHNLILTAVDGGTPARSGTASVIVRVLDTNDNTPTFGKMNYSIKIMENSPIGTLVVHLNATDLDEGSNSDITYSYSLYTSEKSRKHLI